MIAADSALLQSCLWPNQKFPARSESQISDECHSCFADILMFVEFVAVAIAAAVHICPRNYLVLRVRNLKFKVVNSLKPAHQWSQRRRL